MAKNVDYRGIEYEDDGPPPELLEPERKNRRDGFATVSDGVPTEIKSGTSLLDRTDRGAWPDIPELESPIGGSGKR